MSRRTYEASVASATGIRVGAGADHVCPIGDSWWEYDAQGIPLCRVCSACQAEKLSHYRPEILTGYTQADVDEPIEEPD